MAHLLLNISHLCRIRVIFPPISISFRFANFAREPDSLRVNAFKVTYSIRKPLLEARKDNYQHSSQLLTRRNYNNYSNSNSKATHFQQNHSQSASPRRFYPQKHSHSTSYDHHSQTPSSQPSPAPQYNVASVLDLSWQPPKPTRKRLRAMVGPTMINRLTVINSRPPGKSISKKTNSEEELKNDRNTELREETEEWYPHISPIEANEEYRKRNRIDTDVEFLDTAIPFTKQNCANLFDTKQSRVYTSISAAVRKWHPQIVKIDSAAGPNLIDIELLKP